MLTLLGANLISQWSKYCSHNMGEETFYKGYCSEVQGVNLSKVAKLESDGAEIWTVWLQSLLSPLY